MVVLKVEQPKGKYFFPQVHTSQAPGPVVKNTQVDNSSYQRSNTTPFRYVSSCQGYNRQAYAPNPELQREDQQQSKEVAPSNDTRVDSLLKLLCTDDIDADVDTLNTGLYRYN